MNKCTVGCTVDCPVCGGCLCRNINCQPGKIKVGFTIPQARQSTVLRMSHNFTRREILAALLGVPAAFAACSSQQELPPLPPGEIVGASDVIGHRIRDGLNIPLSQVKSERVRVVIVGGGVAGLSASRRLVNAGIEDFVLMELEQAPGGTARS